MNLRIARKITLRSLGDHPDRLSPRERVARRRVIRHWSRLAFPRGTFSATGERRAHADTRALTVQERRVLNTRGAT